MYVVRTCYQCLPRIASISTRRSSSISASTGSGVQSNPNEDAQFDDVRWNDIVLSGCAEREIIP